MIHCQSLGAIKLNSDLPDHLHINSGVKCYLFSSHYLKRTNVIDSNMIAVCSAGYFSHTSHQLVAVIRHFVVCQPQNEEEEGGGGSGEEE